MKGAHQPLARTLDYDCQDGVNDAKSVHDPKKIFSTKLSLPKFMSVSKMLTLEQRRLVSTMGFHHLLDLCCDSVPRGISIWLAKSFDVKSRTLLLPNGSRISITPLSVHRVLGIPNGGKAITKKCEDCVKNWISQETRCKGSTPTINELKALFTPQLRGNNFKMVFTLFAVSSFLCPTSYGSASTDYYSAIALPDEISEYDWCAAVLDKITQSIEFYQKTEATTSTATLGGCILVLVIIYFELLDIPISRDFQDIPLLKFWSTDMVKAFETLDAKDDNHTVFGRLPVKDLTRTPFWTGALADSLTSHATKMHTREYSESAQDRDQVAATIQELQRDIINAIEPIMSSYTDRIYNLWVSPQVSTKAQKHDSFGGGSNVSPQLNVANLVVERKTHTHTGDPHSVDKNQECVVTASLKTDNLNVEETDAHHSESLEPKPPLEGVLVSTKPHVTSTKEMSSFLQVPSFSQDSSSNPVSNATQPKIHSVKQNHSTETSECSHSKPHPPHLQPRITLAENMATSVFQSRQSSSTNTLQRKETNASVLDIPTAEANTDDRDAEQTTKSNDFNFWGDGFDSDFEVKPPAKLPDRVNFQIQANQHGKKRTRSLNESIYDAIISERKREDTASRCTTGSDQAMNNAVNGIESTPLTESSIQELNPSNFNEEFYDQINMEEIMQSTPATQTKFCYNFSSQLVEKEVFKDIVDRIPFSGPRPRVIEIRKVWVDHKTFGLSMRVFGTVSKYTLDVMGQAIMAEQFEKERLGLLPPGSWYRHIMTYERAKLFQASNFEPSAITKMLTEYKVDKMDLVFLPLYYDQFWYLIVANFRHKRFEVLCPNVELDSVRSNAETAIFNFKMTFKYAYPRLTTLNIFDMTTTFRSVTWSKNHCDSGIFVMKLMQSHDGDSQHLFKPEDAKPLRECLLYYLVTHPCNEKYDTLVDTKKILNTHGITVNFYH